MRHTMRHVSLFICILLMAGAAVLIGSRGQSPSNQELGELQVTCFSLENGQAALIQCGDHAVLIDEGSADDAPALLQELEDRQVTRLDALVLSYFSPLRMGGAAQVLRSIPTEAVYAPDYDPPADSQGDYRRLLQAIEDAGIPVQLPDEKGDTLTLGDAQLTLERPLQGHYEATEGDYSLAASLEHGVFSFLFPGDAGEQRLGELMAQLPLSHTVLVLPEQGAVHENTEAFLRAVDPQAAVLTGAKAPSEELLTLLNGMEDLKLRDLYCTADGDLTFTSNGLDELTITQAEK
ncbi:hypothetical protein B5E65_07615 [Gemmiger sp. An120]|uniref:ComEC/Rec2 family competence protein n=1 Tax=Gemmiger sp. An120 TaxID=1965549 RepID=UPI000B38C051|nr:hypothetical protein [Gemmiger sp. An120]OUQ42480.1 hypothetical protein B5E65_07615 [Gemmiger sp. An120]